IPKQITTRARRWGIVLLAASLCLCGSSPSRADTFYPMVMSISPVAVQAGTTAECEVDARYNLHGTYRVFVTGDGVTAEAEAIPPAERVTTGRRRRRREVSKIKVRFKAAPDAMLGVRDVRLATPQGASTLGQLVVVRDPVVREAANNDTPKTAQAIPLPATVCGAIEKPEDVDYYKFTVKAGTALTFHVRGQRLENKIHDLQEHLDPILTLRNAAGTILAANDNYFFGDPLLHYHFDRAGEYYLEIRDARYGGNPYWQYSIEINDRPFVTNVYPSCVAPGQTARLRLVGYNLPPDPAVSFSLPADAAEGTRWVRLPLPGGERTNAVPLVVSRLPGVTELDGDHATAATAQPIPVPAGVCGRIAREGEVDCYAFPAKAGEHFTFRVVARDHQSMLDSNLRILKATGERLAENDDGNDRFIHADSLIEDWAAPADGRYVVEIRDLHLRGGPAFVYFLEVTRTHPHFTLELDTDKTPLAPGMAGVLYARVRRHEGFTGEVQLGIEGLPKGVTAECGRILAADTDGCILLRAEAGAPVEAANVRVFGTATVKGAGGKAETLTATARPLQEIYMPGGGRFHYPVEMHTVSVGDPLDIRSVKITPAAVTLKPGESKRVEVVLERAPGFEGSVTLDVVYQHLGSIYGSSLPPGVSIDEGKSLTLLTGKQAKGYVTLKAAADAKPAANQLVPVMAHVSINFVMKFTY
ncbi:MAG TPA: PPC domain-containing protein, partial [Gemmataceae bacterium]|nr:PPC domain-containing protein [Gemmataceae bacterium]